MWSRYITFRHRTSHSFLLQVLKHRLLPLPHKYCSPEEITGQVQFLLLICSFGMPMPTSVM
ncbi:hypothetical protein A3734_02325 [Sulfitobacter sp. HI0054]|nr:hypothetical protein A3734_02325 [Sulfitobacter sp. HI0054]